MTPNTHYTPPPERMYILASFIDYPKEKPTLTEREYKLLPAFKKAYYQVVGAVKENKV